MKTILIVDDSATTRALIRAVIDDLGDDVETVEASSGFEALKNLPLQDYSLVITDINMPDINGLELINFIRTNARYANIPIIIVSTESTEEDKKRGMALGATGYITKPFKLPELQEIIKRTLGL